MLERWNHISVVEFTQPETAYSLSENHEMTSDVRLNLAGLNPEDVGVEMLFTTIDEKGRMHITERCEYKVVEFDGVNAHYHTSIIPERTGLYQVATRVYPKKAELPHRQDFPLIKWL